MSSRCMRAWCVVVAFASLAGCGDDDDDAVTDGGTGSDAAAAVDSGAVADAAVSLASDTICAREVPRATSYWVDGARLRSGAAEVRLYGLNWFGLETPDRAPHGLWTRDLDAILTQVAGYGFNALRVPVSPESIRPGFASASWSVSGSIDTGREQLERLIARAAANGMRVLLDFHTCNPAQLGGSLPGTPIGCSGYSTAMWKADLETMADIATAAYPTVVGIDLTNEPHMLTWTAWRGLAEMGGNAVLCREPRILVFVEGVGNASNSGGSGAFWGENLTDAAGMPVALPASRLVWSPHVYGPSVSPQSYFNAGNFPANMPAIWESHFGHLATAGKAVVPGEFGGDYDDALAPGDRAWQDAFVTYLLARDVHSFFYWSLNPNSADTGGILMNDWVTPVQAKLTLLARLMQP